MPRPLTITSRMRNVCFTMNNPTQAEKEFLSDLVELGMPSPGIRYMVFQEEEGESGTKHIQGYVEFLENHRFRHVKFMLTGSRTHGIHLERRRGTPKEAADYCKKFSSRVDGGIAGEGGVMSKSMPDKLSNVILAVVEGDSAADIQQDFPLMYMMNRDKIHVAVIDRMGKRHLTPSKSNVYIFVGPSGSGKSTTAWTEYPDAFKGVWPTGKRWWWPNYKGESTVIFDEFRETLSYQQMLALFDIHPMSIEFKGGNTENVSKKIILTTIRDPKDWYRNVSDKTELERRIRDNCTIYDFATGTVFPDFVKTERVGEFKFNDHVAYPGGFFATNGEEDSL